MRVLMIAAALALAIGAAAAVALSSNQTKQTVQGPAKVIDGDTVIVNEIHVRLKGVDAPEPLQSGGPKAALAMHAITGNWLSCELTGETTHGRQVGYCFNAAGKDIAEAIISSGLALSCPRYDIDQRYLKFERPEAVQRQPRASYCGSPPPQAQVPRVPPPPPAQTLQSLLPPPQAQTLQSLPPCHASRPSKTPPSPDCSVKGNISYRTDERIYLSGQQYYDRTEIDPNKGERWFRTEAEALAAGWRKSKV